MWTTVGTQALNKLSQSYLLAVRPFMYDLTLLCFYEAGLWGLVITFVITAIIAIVIVTTITVLLFEETFQREML